MAAITLRPFRDYDEKNVTNISTFSGTIPAEAGTLVKIVQGFVATEEPIEMLGSVGASYNNVQSQRYGAYSKVAACGAGETPIGMLLMGVRETDENGEQLKFNPVKAAEMGVVISGQAVPYVSRGIFHYSGSILASQTPVAQTKLYAGASGQLTTGVTLGALAGYVTASGQAVSGVTSPVVATCLGGKDDNNCVVIRLNIN